MMRGTAETRKILKLIEELPSLETLSVEDGRVQARQRGMLAVPCPPLGRVENGSFPGSNSDVPLRFYHPPEADCTPAILMFFHGSGFVVADLDTHDALCRHLCAAAGALVISVDYRLAPEHPFPAAPDDCLAATLWARRHAQALNGDAGRIIACGDSAGGNLAAVVAIGMRDLGEPLAGQVLLYPVTDAPDLERASYRANGAGFGLSAKGMQWYWQHYVGEQPFDWRAAPLRAHSLAGVAPAFIVTAELDVLRDEGAEFADRLRAAGVAVDYRCVSGVIHAFASMIGTVPESEQTIKAVGDWCRERFGMQVPAADGG